MKMHAREMRLSGGAAVALICLICLIAAPCAPLEAEIVRFEGTTMGTYYSIAVDTDEPIDAAALQERVDARLRQVNQSMSTWISESEISRFNRETSAEWFAVSADFVTVVQEARRIYDMTQGAFDPTVSPLISLWGFADDRVRRIPAAEAIESALANTGMTHVEVRAEPPALRKTKPEIQLNLSAIAKGFGVDAVATLLASSGYPSFVVDIGGEDRAGAPKRDGSFWRLGVESPLGGIQKVVRLSETSIATSGDYRNFFQIGDRRFSHAINPVTGWPVEDPPASVSVIHPSCMTADALATALMVLGSDRGMELAASEGLEVMFLNVANDGTVDVQATGRFVDASTAADGGAEPPGAVSGQGPNVPLTVAEPNADATDAQDVWFPILAALGIFAVAMIGMAVGVLVRNKSLKGSCGGIAALGGDKQHSICELCTTPRDECINTELRERMQAGNRGDTAESES